MKLNWRPKYNHGKAVPPPNTTLTPLTAYEAYMKLKPFLALYHARLYCPAEGWPKDGRQERHLFRPNGFHYKVRWMPNIDKNWRRLTYEEFLAWYGIEGNFAQ